MIEGATTPPRPPPGTTALLFLSHDIRREFSCKRVLDWRSTGEFGHTGGWHRWSRTLSSGTGVWAPANPVCYNF
jgi:hypothetical protein